LRPRWRQRYAHAHQFKRANWSLRKLKTYRGRVIREIGRRIVGNEGLREAFVGSHNTRGRPLLCPRLRLLAGDVEIGINQFAHGAA
jgi:hypothetical protein